MERRVGHEMPRLRTPGFRRSLLMFLAFAYLFVGLAHADASTDEVVIAATSSDSGNMLGDGAYEGSPKKLGVAAGHCCVSAPVVMPVLHLDGRPLRVPVTLYPA